MTILVVSVLYEMPPIPDFASRQNEAYDSRSRSTEHPIPPTSDTQDAHAAGRCGWDNNALGRH